MILANPWAYKRIFSLFSSINLLSDIIESAKDLLAPVPSSKVPTANKIEFETVCIAWPIVAPTFSNSLSIAMPWLSKALIIVSAVIFPSPANSLIFPKGTFIPSAIALASLGVFSKTELSSSPLKVPLAKPWPNWTNAVFTLSTLPPPKSPALLIVWVIFNNLSWLILRLSVDVFNLLYNSALLEKETLVSCEILNNSFWAVANSFVPSVTSLNLLFIFVNSSAYFTNWLVKAVKDKAPITLFNDNKPFSVLLTLLFILSKLSLAFFTCEVSICTCNLVISVAI